MGLFGMFLVMGCGLTIQQKGAVNQFATATRDLSVSAQAEFQRSRQDVVEMNRFRLELGDPMADVNKLDSLLTLDRTRDRIMALQALEDYGGLLNKLVGIVPEGELLEASNTFVGSLKQVKGVQLTDQEAGGIGKAVAAVGGLYVEYKRAAAVRHVVETTHAPVLAVIDLVKKDFDPNSDFWSAGYRKTAVDLSGHAESLDLLYPPKDLLSKQSTQRAKTLATENMNRFSAISVQIMTLVSTLAEAQKNLRLVLNPSELNVQSIDHLATQVRDFKTIYGLLRNEAPR
ncbi:MAG: hypothetical protein E8D46_16350 [Nitrospira sp.]|nr:MAG: hypothetical protein E8D46_16350 [Nitrospira sp.]